jgi:pimeloyl-ACP methyl ester carboxylesterase
VNVTLADGVRLHVRDSRSDGGGRTGEDTPVLLLHGWPDTGDLWHRQTAVLEAAGYRVIAPDLRGFGGSDKPTDVAAYAAPALVGDVLGVLDALDVSSAHLVGHDWGAAIAWMTAALAPDRVRTLTALSVGHPASFRSAGWRQKEKSWYMLLFQFPEIAERWLSVDDFANLRGWSSHPDPAPVMDRLRDPAALTASLGPYRANLSAQTLVEPPPQLPVITVPTLGIWSRGDGHLTEEQMTGSSAYVTGPWRYECLEDSGHWIPLDAPDVLATLLLDTFERTRTCRRRPADERPPDRGAS